MNPLKRTERAKAKERARGERRHRSPEPTRYPLTRTHHTDVPEELAEREYDFPDVELPKVRPEVSAQELRAALDDEPQQPHAGYLMAAMGRAQLRQDFPPKLYGAPSPSADAPTQELPRLLAGKVVDETPQPAAHQGLEPVTAPVIPEPMPVPSTPFLNATPAPAPAAPRRPGRVFSTFDNGFWSKVTATQRRAHSVADVLAADNDAVAVSLDAHLDRMERLVRGVKPLPRRVPGAALKALEASRGELAVAR